MMTDDANEANNDDDERIMASAIIVIKATGFLMCFNHQTYITNASSYAQKYNEGEKN